MTAQTSLLEQTLQATGLSSAVFAHVIDEPRAYGMRTVAPATRNLKPEFRW